MNAESLTATKNELLAELHKDVFLTPKGMIKFVQLFVVICAFALTTSASGTSTMTIKAGDGKGGKLPAYGVKADLHTSYPFKKYKYSVSYIPTDTSTLPLPFSNKTEEDLLFKDGFQSESQFYVFVGVIAFLYTIATIICYAFYKKFEKMSDYFGMYFTKVDFVTTAALTFLWFLSVTLWSAGFSALRNDLDPPQEFPVFLNQVVTDSGAEELCLAPSFPCISTSSWSKLYGSVVFGYLCILLFGVNCWYCFKDTEWHSEPEKLGGILKIRTDNDTAGPAGLEDVNLEAGGGDTATIQPGAI